jgi:hypothetical protein
VSDAIDLGALDKGCSLPISLSISSENEMKLQIVTSERIHFSDLRVPLVFTNLHREARWNIE